MLNCFRTILMAGFFVTTTVVFSGNLSQASANIDSEIPQLGDALKNPGGLTEYLTFNDALSACPTGSHLPTARELAQYAQSLGAKGILEISQVNPSNIPSGYYLVSVINPGNMKDEFYFNYHGYQFPTGGLSQPYWSSSAISNFYYSYAFSGYGGELYLSASGDSEVRCASDR